jgi:UDP-N-acetyl-D-mannosaminuronate dehydrogenase
MRVLRKGLTMMATPASDCDFDRDVAVVGGCGHVGLPLAIALADRGARVVIYDVSEEAVAAVKAGRVLCTDPHVTTDPRLLPQDHVISQGDLLIIAAPHSQYRHLDTAKPVADVWNVAGQGVRV